MIITVTFNPAIDKTAEVDTLCVGGLNRLKNVTMDAGGKGVNVSKTIQALGGESLCTGFLAGSTGDFIEQTLEGLHISHDFVRVAGSTRTNLKVLDQHMELTELNEAGPTVSDLEIEQLKHRILKHCDEDTIVVLSGNVSPGVDPHIYEDFIRVIQQTKAKAVLDADGPLFANGINARPAFIKPNKYELATHFGMDETCTNEEIVRKAKTLLNEDTTLVVVSMGKEGSIFITKEAIYQAEALSITAHSAVGAGDAMVAAITYALTLDLAMEDLIRLSVATSAGAVMTIGTNPAPRELIDTLMENVNITTWEE